MMSHDRVRLSSEQLFERAKRVAPGGVHSPVRAFRNIGIAPRFIDRAEGAYLYDVDGRRYIDFCMSWGPLIFGHQDPETGEAVRKALEKGWSYGAAEPYSLKLAEFIVDRLPWVEKIRFVCSGTEAVMSALRVARAATGRSKILKFDGCYHGHVDSMLVKSGSGLAEAASADSAGVPPETAWQTLVCPLDDEVAFEKIWHQWSGELAAVILEPLPANYGLLVQRQEWLRRVVDTAQKNGVLVIFDEVISGFRVAFGGMAEKLGVRPDLVTYGKILGGGFPVGAYGGRRDLMDLVAPVGPVYQAGTLAANPVAVAAGLATLKKLSQGLVGQSSSLSIYEKIDQACENLSEDLEKLAQARDLPLRVQRSSSLFWPVFKKQPVRSVSGIPQGQKEAFAILYRQLLDRGLYLAPSGFEVGFVSTVHSPHLMQEVSSIFADALKACEKEIRVLIGG